MGTRDVESVEVASADGTMLAARVSGQGSALLLVHGAAVDSNDWLELPRFLADEHTVWSYDRRGRGGSGDADSYELEREVDDTLAVLAAIGEPVHLVGHSFGAVCALKAAATGVRLRSLVVYEPPVHVNRSSAAVDRAVAHFHAGDRDAAVATFLSDVAGLPPDELDSFRADSDAWNATTARAETIFREVPALARLAWDPLDYRTITVPAMHIAGGLTDAAAYPTHEDISDALPHASLVTIPDQGHVAFADDPAGFARVILEFTRPLDRGVSAR